jgi:hypothetical protein
MRKLNEAEETRWAKELLLIQEWPLSSTKNPPHWEFAILGYVQGLGLVVEMYHMNKSVSHWLVFDQQHWAKVTEEALSS